MNIAPELSTQVFSLPAAERYELAQRLLDSVDQNDDAVLHQEFVAELRRRRAEMLSGSETIDDWRAAMEEIKISLSVRDAS